MAIPDWLTQLRQSKIIDAVRKDKRSNSTHLLGVPFSRIYSEVIKGGQANFDEGWEHLTSDEKTLLYAYFNQQGHIEELHAAFELLFSKSTIHESNPIIIDLGCGPFTAGLAILATFPANCSFTYIGLDHSESMQRLGNILSKEASILRGNSEYKIFWCKNLDQVNLDEAKSWRPVIVIVSYLLASPTINATSLINEVDTYIQKISAGPATVLYTNSIKDNANKNFNSFQTTLNDKGFELKINEDGNIKRLKQNKTEIREFKYALFHREAQSILKL